MGPGLVKLLDLIARSPAESMLVDRVLVLASGVPEFERIEVTLRLARVLLDGNPRRGLEIAWMLYQSGLRDFEALSVIAQALERLKRPQKARIIREELRRLKNDTLSDFAKGAARSTIEKQVTTTLAGDDDDAYDDTAEVTRTEARPTAGEFQISIDTLVPPGEPGPGVDGESGRAAQHRPERDADDAERLARKVRISRINKVTAAEGIPEAIPPKEPSVHQAEPASVTRVEPTRHSVRRPFNAAERRQRIMDLVQAEQWEALLEFIGAGWSEQTARDLTGIFAEHKLWRLDIRFAMIWIDLLRDSAEERRAVRFALRKLADEPHLAWARQIYPKMADIAERLGLVLPSWRESEGVAALKLKIALMRPAGGQFIVAAKSKAS